MKFYLGTPFCNSTYESQCFRLNFTLLLELTLIYLIHKLTKQYSRVLLEKISDFNS